MKANEAITTASGTLPRRNGAASRPTRLALQFGDGSRRLTGRFALPETTGGRRPPLQWGDGTATERRGYIGSTAFGARGYKRVRRKRALTWGEGLV
jgi:hypothetical protein